MPPRPPHHTFLFADFNQGVRELLPEFQAEEIKSIGDAVMVRVPDAASAVELAVRLIGDVGARHGSLAVRVGAHTGPAVHREGDWFGAAVNLAARVAAVAKCGEVLMTEATCSAAGAALSAYEIETRRGQAFKNVAEPVTVHALTLAAQPDVAHLPTDPVCRMAVDPGKADERRVWEGMEIHFCSAECAAVFDRHPDRYALHRAAAG
ncbi:MAG TPA: YHS domain-containing protein [Thermoleophilaceae bacterium]